LDRTGRAGDGVVDALAGLFADRLQRCASLPLDVREVHPEALKRPEPVLGLALRDAGHRVRVVACEVL
jgi:hypothetical protein